MKKNRIDPHVHCRDGKQSYKETIEHAIETAEAQGIGKIFDMPNTDPTVTREKDVQRRLDLVPEEKRDSYYLYMGATSSEDQLEEALETYDDYEEIIGIKMYAGESVGNLAIVDEKSQKNVYRTLTELGYQGVIAVHCEKEEYMKPSLWNPSKPVSHSEARPKKAEVESVEDQIQFIRETGFKGHFHQVHSSCSKSIDLVNRAKESINATCGVTPHHVLWSKKMLERPDGTLYKMNPPLRSEKEVEKLRKRVKEGKVDWIETDHAPHPVGNKLYPPYSSGFPSLYLYEDFVEQFLPSIGLEENLIRRMTYKNIKETFNLI